MMNMINYQPEIIEEFAGRLYAEADRIIISLMLLCFVLGAIGARVLLGVLQIQFTSEGYWVWSVIIGGFASLVGHQIGQNRSFSLRLQAQTALCQVQIEANTRAAAVPVLGAIAEERQS
jgi:hypothetical protein